MLIWIEFQARIVDLEILTVGFLFVTKLETFNIGFSLE